MNQRRKSLLQLGHDAMRARREQDKADVRAAIDMTFRKLSDLDSTPGGR